MIVESKIEAVTLYHRGATVERSAAVEAKDGRLPQKVVFSALPLALVDDTVRVRLSGVGLGGAEQVLAVSDLKVGLSAYTEDEAVSPPEQSALDDVIEELAKKRLLLEQLEQEKLLLSSIELPDRPVGEHGQPVTLPSPITARVALEQFSHEAVERRITEARELRLSIESLEEEEASLRGRLRQYSQSRELKPHSLYKIVEAQIRQGEDVSLQEVRLTLSYFVPGARWVPTYQCRLRRDGTSAEIQMRALVSQKTGEDWGRVKLSLSTADPMRWSALPELSSLRIGQAQPVAEKRGFRPPPKGAGALFVDFDQGREKAVAALPSPESWAPIPLYCAPLPEVADAYAAAPPKGSIKVEDGEDMDFMYTSEVDMPANTQASFKTQASFGGMPQRDMAPPPPPAPKPPAVAAEKLRSVRMEDLKKEAFHSSLSASGIGGGGEGYGATETIMDAMLIEEEAFDLDDEASLDLYADVPAPKKKSAKARRKKKPAAPRRDPMARLRYTQLELGDPEDNRERGRLRPIEAKTRYMRSLQRLSLQINIDVISYVEKASQLASHHDSQPLPEGTSDVKLSTGHFDYSYTTDATVDVPSDGLDHSIAVSSRDAGCDMQYVVVPREDPQAYRVASLRNPLHAPLLPGPAEIYIGGEYILSTQLPVVPPSGDMRLWLGVEQAIKCARNTRYRERRSGTKVVAMNELHHDIDIEVANRLGRAIQCEVHERIPQPDKEAEIVVEEGSVSPAWEPYDQEERGRILEGGRRWKIQIPANEKASLRASYTIKIYANNEIVGGNRRES